MRVWTSKQKSDGRDEIKTRHFIYVQCLGGTKEEEIEKSGIPENDQLLKFSNIEKYCKRLLIQTRFQLRTQALFS